MATDQPQTHFGIQHLWDKLVAAAVGLGGGYLAGYKTVRDQFDHDMKHAPHHAEIHEAHAKELGELTEAFFEPEEWLKRGDRRLSAPPKDLDDYTKLVTEAKVRHAREYAKPMEAKGLAGSGWRGHTTGLYRKFKLMGPDSKFSTVFNSVVTTGFAAGATYTFLSNMQTRHKINEVKAQLDAKYAEQEQARGRS